MSSQQELLNAINTISGSKDKAFDTPATVLRVDGDTVWVHIDGGADETPVLKTINCEQGETVQVRISNGNAFLVGNASAPPTDDKTANVAHFVAVEADAKATEAIESITAIEQTVREKVDIGDSNIQDLSSTMYQNANGVNIYNDTLAVGDSYAHIDGDSFDIKEATSAGVIDDANDITLATFGANETVIGLVDVDGYRAKIKNTGISLTYKTLDPYYESGWSITADQISYYGSGGHLSNMASLTEYGLNLSIPPGDNIQQAKYLNDYAELYKDVDMGDTFRTRIESGEITVNDERAANITKYSKITPDEVKVYHSTYLSTDYTDITPGLIENTGNVKIGGEVQDLNGTRKYVAEPSSEGTNGQVLTTDGSGGRFWATVSGGPTVLTSTTISAATTSYTFSDAAIAVDSVIDIYDTIFGFAPTGMTVSNGSCVVTFPAQSSSHTIKLFVY